jgi:GPH family glycoside/pentoside/hexuronide:cation symporter
MPPPTHHETAAPDRVPPSEKFALGLGQAAAMGTHNALTTLANPVYNVMMGMSPAYLSILTFVQRFWDAFLDPCVGQFSDNLRTRWGRRRPLILLAALPMSAGFALLWLFPRGLGQGALVAYCLGASLLFYFCHSFFFVPLTALQVEATADYHESTRVASVVGICTWAFSVGNQWLFPLIESRAFADPLTGVRGVTACAAVLYFLMALAPALWVRERPPKRTPGRRRKEPFFHALRETGRNRDFVLLLGVRSVSQLGYSIVAVLGFYLNCYLVHGGDVRAASSIQGWLGTAYVAASVLAFWLFRLLALRLGKQRTLELSAGVLILGAIIKLVVYQPGWRWPQLLVPATNGLALAGINLVTTAMLADIISADELATHQRRGGLYASVISWLDKVGSSTGALLSGFLLVGIGFDVQLGGQQSSYTLTSMKWIYAAFPMCAAVITVVLARKYTLTEARAYEVKQALERQQASEPQEESC